VKTLYLLRHAKAVRPDDRTDDHERPLTPRGMRAGAQMGRWLSRTPELPAPEIALCSTARRVADTFCGFSPHLERRPLVQTDRALYLASAGQLLDAIQRVEDRYAALVVVGHNPGLHALALQLVGGGDGDAAERLARKFPTAGLAVLRFPVGSWRDVEIRGGELLHFVTPRSPEG
jgi:phosphohistidine phosphatase